MCWCMKVSKNGYYNWLKTIDKEVELTPKEKLMKRIKDIFKESRHIYGSPKIKEVLAKEGLFTVDPT